MIECNKCGGACKDDALYCEHCGVRLDTKSCRKCGFFVPEEAKYCSKCGYPTSGNVCSRCGKINPEESAFCSTCGNKLSASAPAAAPANVINAPAASVGVAPAQAAAKQPKQSSGLGMKIYGMFRVFVLPALLMCMFIFSFFGTFRLDDTGVVTGFDAVRGMFLLISPQDFSQNISDFTAFVQNGNYNLINADSAIDDFGVLRFLISKQTVFANIVMYVLMWGLLALAIMVLTLTFFILSLVHAVKYARGEKEGFYKHEAMALALPIVLTFGFLVTGGALAGAAITNVVLGCLGLAGITACKFFIEKTPRPTVFANVRRGVCAALAVMIMCFAGSSVINIGYAVHNDDGQKLADSGANVNIGYIDLTDAMSGSSEYFGTDFSEKGLTSNPDYTATESDKTFMERIIYKVAQGESLSAEDLQRLVFHGTPAKLCFSVEAENSYGIGATILGWLSFAILLFTAGVSVMFLYKLLMEESEPEKKHKTTLWSVLTMAGAIAMLISPIIFTVIGNTISTQLGLGFKYSIGALPIVTAALGLIACAIDIVLHKINAKKKTPEVVAEYAAIQPAQEQTAAEQNQ